MSILGDFLQNQKIIQTGGVGIPDEVFPPSISNPKFRFPLIPDNGGNPGEGYLLRDIFSADQNPLQQGDVEAGYRNPGSEDIYCENGIGFFSTESSIIRYQAEENVEGFSRVGGRTFCAILTPTDAADIFEIWLNEEVDETASGYGLALYDKSILVYLPDSNSVQVLLNGQTEFRCLPYVVGITLNEDYGAAFWISTITEYTPLSAEWKIPTYPEMRLLYVTNQGSFSTVYPVISSSPEFGGRSMVRDVRLLDVPEWSGEDGMADISDRFEREAGPLGVDWTVDSGTWAVTGIENAGAELTSGSLVSQAWMLSETSDALITCDIYTGNNNGGTSEIIARRSASFANTAMYFYFYNGNAIALDDATLGSFENIYAQGGLTINAGATYPMVLGLYGQEARFWFDDTQSVMPPTAILNDGTGRVRHGLAHYGSEIAQREWRKFAVWPLFRTLPESITAGQAPYLGVAGSTLNQSEFSGSIVDLDAYTPDVGGSWTEVEGAWIVNGSGFASVTGGTERRAYVSISQADVEVETLVLIPPGVLTVRSGILLWVDSNNYIFIRLFDQPAQHNEVEIWQTIGGSTNILGKAYLGGEGFFTTNTYYELKVQARGRDLNVFVDDVPWFYGYLDSAVENRVAAGIYQENVDDGCVFSSFTVRGL